MDEMAQLVARVDHLERDHAERLGVLEQGQARLVALGESTQIALGAIRDDIRDLRSFAERVALAGERSADAIESVTTRRRRRVAAVVAVLAGAGAAIAQVVDAFKGKG